MKVIYAVLGLIEIIFKSMVFFALVLSVLGISVLIGMAAEGEELEATFFSSILWKKI